MPKFSAMDAISPAMERVKPLILPFRVSTWLKLGFIGWLAGEISGGFNLNFPTSFPGRESLPPGSIPNIHFPTGAIVAIIAAVAAFVFLLGLVFLYLSCRFRFILMDTLLHGQADIGRGWSAYRQAANRYFGFSVLYAFVSLLVFGLIVGLPVWRAYKRGIFSHGDVLGPILVLIGSILVMLLLFGVISYVISTAFRDFVAPLLALDNLRLSEAWAAVWLFIRSEPGDFALYLLMKVVLAIAVAIGVGLASFLIILVLVLPAIVIAVALIAAAVALKNSIAVAFIITIGVILGIALFTLIFGITIMLNAPGSLFFESYRLHFFAGRYPRLEALLWPAPAAPPVPQGLTPPPPLPEPGVVG